jgi:prolyl-tRNA editing enzyme YbaK/EbsC (Cys-tRNA(Pro) deacylase)
MFLTAIAPYVAIIDYPGSTATVAEAAAMLSVEPARIAKTLSLRTPDGVVLIVARGDARFDHAKMKAVFGGRARMLGADEVMTLTGHPVGGVCPFGLATPLPILCDVALRGFASAFPAAGSPTSSGEIAPERLAVLVEA